MDEVGKILEEMALFEGPLLERRQRLAAGRRAEVPPRLRHMDIKLFVLLILTWLVCSESTLHSQRLRLARDDCHPQLPALQLPGCRRRDRRWRAGRRRRRA